MADKILISISTRQVSAARWRGGRFVACEVFPYNEDGLTGFRSYLGAAGRAPVHMLADVVEEDYRLESLPHSFGNERAEMVNRKLRQFYRNTPYISAQFQGRDDSKRRDDHYLFSAITNPELIAQWVQAVTDCGLPMAGIYLAPCVTETLINRLQSRQATQLVVSADNSGLRLTFLRDQKLRISRFAHIDSSGAQAIKNYAEEISNTRLYLHALRILTLDEQLSVLVVDRTDTLSELVQAIARDNPNIECRHLGRQDILAQTGITAQALDSSGDALSLHLLGLSAPTANLAPANVTTGYRHHQARRGIYALAGVLGLAVAMWCAFGWYQIFDLTAESRSAAGQTARLQAEYLEATKKFPAAPTTAENLKRAVEISQRIGGTLRSPETMMDLVSRATESSPAISLKTVGWKYDRHDLEPGSGKSPAPVNDAGTTTTARTARRESGLIEGEVRPFNGDYRAAIEIINRYAETLRKHPQVAEVRVLKLPLNISPSLTLSGNTTENREQFGKAEFSVQLVLKQTP